MAAAGFAMTTAYEAKLPLLLRAHRLLRSVVPGSLAQRAFFKTQWLLAIRPKKWRSLQDRDNYGFHLILPPKDRFFADPFLFEHDGQTCIFFEDYRYSVERGVISCVTIDPTGGVSKPIAVLDVGDHLSYPFVFEVGGQIYMLPESSQMKRVELYRCISFPTEWEPDHVLIERSAEDATLWQQGGVFWLFAHLSAAIRGVDREGLHLFFADSLDAKWTAHPMNPVVVDMSGARPAGRLFLDGDQLIRPAQDGSAGYGRAIVLKRVLELTRTEYREEALLRITPEWVRGAVGTHTLDHNGKFEVVDVKAYRLKTVEELARDIRRRAGGPTREYAR